MRVAFIVVCFGWIAICLFGGCRGRGGGGDSCSAAEPCDPGLACSDQGRCVADDINLCDGVDCGNNGRCAAASAEPLCVCDSGYHASGLTCVADQGSPCEGIDCSGRGACAERDGAPVCICEDGYRPEGQRCVEDNEPAQNGPQILTIGTDVEAITEDESVTISAVVTDPDGIDDVIGGVLRDPGGAQYGPFATSASEGAYGIEISWDDIDAVATIEFDGTGQRLLVAEFYDTAGHTTTAEVTLTLECPEDGAACEGKCVDLDTSFQNCGQCGRFCDGCAEGRCHFLSSCATEGDCAAQCAAEGGSCSAQARCWFPISGDRWMNLGSGPAVGYEFHSQDACETPVLYVTHGVFEECDHRVDYYSHFRCCCAGE